MARPRIVCLVDKSPLPESTGSRVRIRHLVEALSTIGDVTLMVLADVSDSERQLLLNWDAVHVILPPRVGRRPSTAAKLGWLLRRPYPVTWQFRSLPVVQKLVDELLTTGPDLVWVSGPSLEPVLRGDLDAPLIVDVESIEREAIRRDLAIGRRTIRSAPALRAFLRAVTDRRPRLRAERVLWSRASLITPVSIADAAKLPAAVRDRVTVVPNGAVAPVLTSRPRDPHRLVFVGSLNYAPNLDAVRWMADEILPLIRRSEPCTLHVAGAYPRGLQAPEGVELLGFVPDLDILYSTASLALVPLRAGSGTKVKVLEACAHGVPVVTTPIGVEGLPLHDGEHVLVRSDAGALAEAVVSLVRDRERAELLAARARAIVEHQFAWGAITADFAERAERLAAEGTPPPSRRILVVETEAHVRSGHYPVMFAELAGALVEAGCEVTVLTSEGWALEAELGGRFEVRRLGRIASGARRLAGRLGVLPPRRLTARVAARAQDVVVVLVARRIARRLGGADVIVTTARVNPYVVAALAGPARWLLYQFRHPGEGWRTDGPHRRGRPVSTAIGKLARRAELRRRRHGGQTRIAVNNPQLLRAWTAATPWLDPLQLSVIACRERSPIGDARQRLGLEQHSHVALLFGSAHGGKDPQVAWRAFEQLADWTLVIAGKGAADAYRSWRDQQHTVQCPPMLFEGFVDDETRNLLHAATDLVVLSFHRGFDSDSGTLVDAVSWGVPVVCSSDCCSATIVTDLGLGLVYECGDADALAVAVLSCPPTLDADVLRGARDELSGSRMAQQHLSALGASGPS